MSRRSKAGGIMRLFALALRACSLRSFLLLALPFLLRSLILPLALLHLLAPLCSLSPASFLSLAMCVCACVCVCVSLVRVRVCTRGSSHKLHRWPLIKRLK
jgi:hypothetical protein